MKKKTNGILVGLIVITVLFGVLAPVQALGVSFTISGQVFDTDGTTPVDGVTMTVTDLETGSKVNTEVTAQGGWYSINLGNLKPDSTHNAGDIIQIHADNGAGKTNTTNVSRAESSPQRGVNVILEGGEEPVLTTIEVTPSTATVNVDATKEFNATAKDQDGNVMSGVVITWTSSNETVGTITDAGVLTADVVGTTTVMAANGTVNGTAAVTVQSGVQPVLTTIEVSPSPATVNVNTTKEFNATAKDQDGNVMSGVVINWTSSNETVGTITDAGLLTALVIGTTTVTAANETVNGTATVTVQEVVPQNLTIANLKADPSTGVNEDNPTNVSATITSGEPLERIVLFAIDTQNHQPKEYLLYVEDIPVGGDDYSADWDATEFEVKGKNTSSGTKPVFVIKADEFETIQIPEYLVIGNLTINTTTEPELALALFDDALKLSEILVESNASSFEPGTTTFTPFAVDATERATIIDPFEILWRFEDLDPVTLTGTAPDYNISLVKEQVLYKDYVVGMAAIDEAGNKGYNETTVSVSAAEANIVYSALEVTPRLGTAPLNITASAKVENTGSVAGNYTASLKIDDVIKEWSNGTLNANGDTTVSFVYNLATGAYNVTIDDLTAIGVMVMKSYPVNGTAEIDAKDIADTEVSITTTAPVDVNIGKYATNPTNTSFTGDFGEYIDVQIDDSANVSNMEIKLFYKDVADESTLKMYWWDGTAWSECSNTGVNTTDQSEYDGYIWAIIDSSTTPSLSDMTDTPFGAAASEPTPTPTPAPTEPPRRRGGGGGGGGVSDSDGDGYSDIEEIIVGTDPYDPCDPNPACVACIGEKLIEEVITTPKPTPTKDITPPPTTPTATPPPPEEPEEPEKTPVPGFEAVFAIAGLLAVAYLVQRRRK